MTALFRTALAAGIATLAASAAALSGTATAQPDSPTTTERQPERDRPLMGDDPIVPPEMVLERLEQRLAELDDARARLAAAADAIRAGRPPREALAPVAELMFERGPLGDGPMGPGRRGARRGSGFDPGLGSGPVGPDGQAGRGESPDDDDRGPAPEITDEHARAFIAEHFPELAERLERATTENPGVARGLLARLKPRLADAIRMRDEDPVFVEMRIEELKIGFEIMQRARRLGGLNRAGADRSEIEAAEAELRTLLGLQFDIEQRLATHRLGRDAERLAEMRTRIDQRADQRDDVVAEQLGRVRERAERRPGRREKRD